MALACGVDLALELPVVFSSHNAGVFANAAVDIIAATGRVGSISFGMETPNIPLTQNLADVLNEEPPRFRAALKKSLGAGFSFVQARGMALDEIVPGSLELLKTPNNNLALAYVKRLREKNYNIEPRAVERLGSGFHDADISNPSRGAASATAIRALVEAGRLEEAYALMPNESARLLRAAVGAGRVVTDRDRLWRAVKQAMLICAPEGLRRISEMGEGLENRMYDLALRADSFGSFVDSCASRRYTKGRIQRHCAHLLIGLSHEDGRKFQENGPAYIRVLGATGRGRKLLAEMRAHATLPVITRASAPRRVGGEHSERAATAAEMMAYEHRATEIWETLAEKPAVRSEARFVPIMVD
jgi:predicted nucleotidyltransferase